LGGSLSSLGGTGLGYLSRFLSRRRAMTVALALTVIASAAIVSRAGLPSRVHARLQAAARYHRGHVLTPGHTYKLLDQRFYSAAFSLLTDPILSDREAGQYVVRAIVE